MSRASNLIHSFSLKLAAVALVLLLVPFLIYWQFQRAEVAQTSLLQNSASQTGRVISALLRPHFEQFASENPQDLTDALEAAAVGATNVKVLMRPAGAKQDEFIYVAAYPSRSKDFLQRERSELIHSGVFARLAPTCDGATDLAVRFVNPKGRPEILTSMTPVHVAKECWIVITSQNVADLAPVASNPSIWSTSALRASIIIYCLSTGLILGVFIQIWRNVNRFRDAARLIRLRKTGAASFHRLNTIPELDNVAGDIDALVAALVSSQEAVKNAAEETAHALKAPLAVISQSLEPIRRSLATSDVPANRALQLIERSLARLDSLVTSARDIEQASAEAVYPERVLMDISEFLKLLLAGHDAALSLKGRRIAAHIDEGIKAYANEELLETAVENLLDNAASYTCNGEAIDVTLARRGKTACIAVADHGPGVAPDMISKIFDRNFSSRARRDEQDAVSPRPSQHAGLGLWIVKRNIEGMGGTVSGRNRDDGGFEVTILLRQEI